MNEKLQELIDHLQGSCIDLSEGCIDVGVNEDELTQSDYNEIDQQIFRCETCGWWYEIAEQAEDIEDLICQDCGNNE